MGMDVRLATVPSIPSGLSGGLVTSITAFIPLVIIIYVPGW
jgi:hypothetical protein